MVENKKILAEKLKKHLNSPEYVAMPDLITHDDRHGDMLTWLWGNKIDGNIHKKDNWITGTDINSDKGNKYESEHMVCYDELEKDDWEEIVNLIEKRNEEKKQIYEQKRSKIKDNLNNTPNLYYRFSASERISHSYFTYPDKHGKYFYIWGVENGREFYLNINANNPVLNNFPWQKNGYYLIETDKKIERNDEFGRPWSDGGETNPSNFHKWVEVGDKITITPYEVENDSELSETEKAKSKAKEIKECDICRKNENEMAKGTEKWYRLSRYCGQKSEILHTCSNCYENKEQEYLQNYEFIFTFPPKDLTHDGIPFFIETIKGGKVDCYAGHKDQNGKILQQQNCSHCQPWKQHQNPKVSEMDIKSLIQYLQKYSIKEISFKNGELIITHNNNIVSTKQINNKQELVTARTLFQKTNQTKITKEDLEKMINRNSNSASTKNPKGDNALWIGIGVGIVLIIEVVVGLVVSKKRKN